MQANQKLRDQTKEISQYVNALNSKVDQIVNRLAIFGETLAGVISYLGEDCIQAKIDELRVLRRQKHEDELEQSVQFMLQNGLATATMEGTEIGPDSFIVGDEVSQDGTKTRIQHELKRLNATGQAKYLGKKVGDEVIVEGFPTKVVIRAIYAIDTVKVREYAEKKKAEAAAKTESESTT